MSFFSIVLKPPDFFLVQSPSGGRRRFEPCRRLHRAWVTRTLYTPSTCPRRKTGSAVFSCPRCNSGCRYAGNWCYSMLVSPGSETWGGRFDSGLRHQGKTCASPFKVTPKTAKEWRHPGKTEPRPDGIPAPGLCGASRASICRTPQSCDCKNRPCSNA